MDPTSAVRTDAVPVIATVLAPGAFASAPFAWLGISRLPVLAAFLNDHEAIALASAILIWVVVGFALDSIGTYVEVYAIDRRRPDRQQMIENWWRYLRIAWTTEPIGQRYLRRLLVTFKFELNMCVAAMVCTVGIVLDAILGQLPTLTASIITGALVVAARLLYLAASGSADVLAQVRERLVRGVGEPPFDADGNPR